MGCKTKYISSENKKLCIGSMSNRIFVQKRIIQYKGSGSEYSFTTVWTVWADVETRSGIDKFSGIVVDNAITHVFKIRKVSALTSEYWINWNDNRYKIESIETINENQFMLLYCIETGSDELNGSKA